MSTKMQSVWRKPVARQKPRDRTELALLVGGIAVLLLLLAFMKLASEVFEGETQSFDKKILLALRDPSDLSKPIGPQWMLGSALDITSLGSDTVLGLAVFFVGGFLLLSAEATTYVTNTGFRLKLALLAPLALICHLVVQKKAGAWTRTGHTSATGRLAGLIELLLWISVVTASVGFLLTNAVTHL